MDENGPVSAGGSEGPVAGVFSAPVRRTRAVLVGVAILAGGVFCIVLASRWDAPESRRQFVFVSDVVWFAAVGVVNIAGGTWAIVSAARSRCRVVLDATGISAGRKHVAWKDVVEVTVRRKTMFLSFGQSLLLTVRAPTVVLTVDVFQLSCSSDEFATAFDRLAEEHGIDVDR